MEGKQELHPALEAEINRLSAEILSGKYEGVESREAVKESLSETHIAKEAQPAEPAPAATFLPDYAKEESPETRLYVESMIDKLWHDGDLQGAIAEIKKRGPLVLDLFHDALTGKFHDIMKQRGILS